MMAPAETEVALLQLRPVPELQIGLNSWLEMVQS